MFRLSQDKIRKLFQNRNIRLRAIEFVESLPKTISGKNRRQEIRSGDEGE